MPTPEILRGIAKFQEQYQAEREFFERLASQPQAPQAWMIACSDSRVAPELITSAGFGNLFVVRNPGNLVPPFGTSETSVGAALEYALIHLHVKHLVVCGHTRCGVIQALDARLDWSREPHLVRHVEYARPARTKVEASGLAPEDLHLATVRENVLLQLENLRSYDLVREAERSGKVALHGWVYHLEAGELEEYDPATTAWKRLAPG